ncbi:class E basic helix-loop-helix protein 41 [Perognathus longimembris pacificus]|uniref:class E basic helix-loop-helix protein 41 n=1 Tax=Perognathus longimembris pacificus TaxID=214514 RepID=UPI002018DE34|nr:class E basic helix-loop-helix protein 41 [Perognathus longimembris pacificus]
MDGGGISRLQERLFLERGDVLGLDYSSLYLCKPKRSMRRDDGKDTYKLPHRLIEKKRRDRINECIAQLKDLLPEHLKLTTLGHLEKAVVLELTLKHLKALTALTEQQHQKIIALQNGERSLQSPLASDAEAFHSGFQTCAQEVLRFLSGLESGAPREPRCAQLLSHLRAVASRPPPPPAPRVPVIQRAQPGAAAAEPDTDTDSGYGGDAEPRPEPRAPAAAVKQEPPGDAGDAAAAAAAAAPAPKRPKREARGAAPGGLRSPDATWLGPLVALGSGAASPLAPPLAPPHAAAAAPLCLPLYVLAPFLERGGLERLLCPAAAATAAAAAPLPLPLPLLYPNLAAFPCLSAAAAASPPSAEPLDRRKPARSAYENCGDGAAGRRGPKPSAQAQWLRAPGSCTFLRGTSLLAHSCVDPRCLCTLLHGATLLVHAPALFPSLLPSPQGQAQARLRFGAWPAALWWTFPAAAGAVSLAGRLAGCRRLLPSGGRFPPLQAPCPWLGAWPAAGACCPLVDVPRHCRRRVP